MAENIVVKSFRTVLEIPADEAYQKVYENGGQGISWLKVNELKDIIRDLKNQGYYKVHLSISANKPALIMMLQACAAAEKDGAQDVAQPTAANAATMPTAGVTAAPPVNQHPSVRPAAPASAPVAAARHASAPGPPTFFSPPKAAQPSQPIQPNPATQAKPSSHKKATPSKPTSNHPGYLYSPKPGDDPDHRARLFRVLQGPRLTAFNMLKQVPGVTEREILDELEIQPVNEALDIDDILFDIVTKRESGQTGHNLVNAGEEEELDALQEQENRDVDRAIRESEQERDVIQQRKRQRVEELRTGRDGYLTTEEYQRSVLLFGCCNAVGDADIALNGRNTDEGPLKVQKTGLASGGSVSGASKCSSGATATSCNSSSAAGLTKQAVQFNNNALHSATSTFTSTLHSNNATSAASANSRALSHKSNSTSSYTYSSTSNHSNHTYTNANANTYTSSNGNNSSSSVVDLTMDSESEDERIVYNRNNNHSHSSGSHRDNKDNTGSQTASNGSSNGSSSGPFSHPNTNITSNPTNATSNNINTVNTTSTANTMNAANATNRTNDAIVSKPNMSRSRIVHKLAHLLDQLHDMETINSAINSANNTSSSIGNDSSSGNSNSSSSSSSSNSGMLTQAVNLHRRIYDVTYVHNCTSQCTTLLNSLRPVLSKLLLVEAEAMKFYENTSVAYLVHTARRIDGKLLCRTLDEAVNQTVVKSDPSATATIAPASTTYYPNDCIYYLPLIERYIKHTSIVALFTHEADKLQKGMHKLQTDGQLVPYIFRKPRIAYYARALATSIDTDGLEVLDKVHGNNNTNSTATGGANSSAKVANADGHRENNNNENESIEVDRCMDSSSEESVASPYNSDDDDF